MAFLKKTLIFFLVILLVAGIAAKPTPTPSPRPEISVPTVVPIKDNDAGIGRINDYFSKELPKIVQTFRLKNGYEVNITTTSPNSHIKSINKNKKHYIEVKAPFIMFGPQITASKIQPKYDDLVPIFEVTPLKKPRTIRFALKQGITPTCNPTSCVFFLSRAQVSEPGKPAVKVTADKDRFALNQEVGICQGDSTKDYEMDACLKLEVQNQGGKYSIWVNGQPVAIGPLVDQTFTTGFQDAEQQIAKSGSIG